MNPQQVRAFLFLSLLCVMMAAACFFAGGCDSGFDKCKAKGGTVVHSCRMYEDHETNHPERRWLEPYCTDTCTPPAEVTP